MSVIRNLLSPVSSSLPSHRVYSQFVAWSLLLCNISRHRYHQQRRERKRFSLCVLLAEVGSAINTERRADLAQLLCATPDCRASYRDMRVKALADYQTAVKAYEPYISYPGERELYQKFTSDFAQYQETATEQCTSGLGQNRRCPGSGDVGRCDSGTSERPQGFE